MCEVWDLYDKNRKKLNITIKKGDRLPEGTYHAVVDVFVVNENNEVLLVKRSKDKEVYPCMWESGAGGSVKAGETFIEAARRELYEETKISQKGLIPIGIDISKISIYTEYFLRVYNNTNIILSDESICYKWVSFNDFLQILKYSKNFMPSKKQRLMKKLNTIKILMNR